MFAVLEPDWSHVDALARAVLGDHGGIAHVSAFDAVGPTRQQTAAVFRRGVLERPRKGWYVDPALPWQVKRAVRVGGIACCVTAAVLLGLPVAPGAHRVLHVLVEEDMTRLRHDRDRNRVLGSVEEDEEVELHRRALIEPSSDGTTSLIDTLRQMLSCVPPEWWVAAVDAAAHAPRGGEPLLDAAGLARLAGLVPRRQRHLVGLVDPTAESCVETLLRLGLLGRGIEFQTHVVVDPTCRVDFLVAGRIVVEADGAAFHDAAADRRRDELLAWLGLPVLRFGYDRIVTDLAGVLDEIEAAIRTL